MKKNNYHGIYGEPLKRTNRYSIWDKIWMVITAISIIGAVFGIGLLTWLYFSGV